MRDGMETLAFEAHSLLFFPPRGLEIAFFALANDRADSECPAGRRLQQQRHCNRDRELDRICDCTTSEQASEIPAADNCTPSLPPLLPPTCAAGPLSQIACAADTKFVRQKTSSRARGRFPICVLSNLEVDFLRNVLGVSPQVCSGSHAIVFEGHSPQSPLSSPRPISLQSGDRRRRSHRLLSPQWSPHPQRQGVIFSK